MAPLVVLLALAAVVPAAPAGLLVPSARSGPLPDLVVIDPATGDTRNLTKTEALGELYPAYSHDGRRLAFTGRGKEVPAEVYVSDADGGNPRQVSAPPAGEPTVAFTPCWSPDGKRVAYARGNNKTGRFEVRVCAADGSADEAVLADAFGPSWSPDGKRVAVVRREPGRAFKLSTIDPDGGNETVLVPDIGPVEFCLPAYSPDGSVVAYSAATEYGWQICLVPAGGGRPRQLTHLPGFNANPVWVEPDRLLFTHVGNPNGGPGAYVSVKADGTRLDTHPLTKAEPATMLARPAAFVPRVATAAPANPVRQAGAVEPAAGKAPKLALVGLVPPVGPGGLGPVGWAADGKRFALGRQDGAVLVVEWDGKSSRVSETLAGHAGPVTGVGFGADNGAVVSAGTDQSVRTWDVTKKGTTGIETDHAAGVEALAVSADRKRVATGGKDGVVKVRDAATGKVVAEGTACDPRRGAVQAVAFGKGDAVVFAGCGRWEVPVLSGAVTAFDAATGKPVWKTKGSMGGVTALAVTPDGLKLVGACLDSFVRVWDAATGKELACWRGHADRVTGVSVSPAGGLVATCGLDHTVRVWDAESGTVVQTLAAHAGPAMKVAFSPDGTHLTSTGLAGAAFVWKVVRE